MFCFDKMRRKLQGICNAFDEFYLPSFNAIANWVWYFAKGKQMLSKWIPPDCLIFLAVYNWYMNRKSKAKFQVFCVLIEKLKSKPNLNNTNNKNDELLYDNQ